ncbi:hypothetical protein AAFX91_21880 [Bradyrhizobium sp. 31Argb]|uniref:hypothetical protein n=1 Tax=Bradyrhizobium sp. 31Argb TaxID=3141247 RepID=UPI00374A7659
MANIPRSLRGKNDAGQIGWWISKPGFNVRFANIMQMAFSSDFIHPKLVIKGSAVNNPTTAVAPFGSGVAPGAEQTVTTIFYGRTVSPIPAAYGIATASDWTVPLAAGGSQLGYLANRWHSYILETPDNNTVVGEYPGPQIQKTTASQAGAVSLNWHSARFVIVPYTDRIEIITNCRSTVTVKYLVLENQ